MNAGNRELRQKILLVDDRRENLLALRKVLEGEDAELIDAGSGDAALAAALRHDFALAILDVRMPGMDGYELASLLRGDPRTRNLPIIFVTAASGEDAQVFKGYESGAVDYIVKPYDSRVLLSKARVFLELHRVTAALAEKLEALAVSEEQFRSLVMTVPDIVYRIDPQGHFTFLNEAVQALGYAPAELLGRHFSEILLPADIEAVSRQFALPRWEGKRNSATLERLRLFDERRTGSRKTAGLEVRLRPRAESGAASPLGGRCVTVEVSSSGLYSAPPGSGRPVFLGTVGVIRDISRRKQNEAELSSYREYLEKLVQERTAALERRDLELERAAQQWQTTFDAMREGVALLDTELRMLRCNRALAELAGQPAAALLGQSCGTVPLCDALWPKNCPCLRACQTLRRETAQVQVGGRWFDLAADPILDEAGRERHCFYGQRQHRGAAGARSADALCRHRGIFRRRHPCRGPGRAGDLMEPGRGDGVRLFRTGGFGAAPRRFDLAQGPAGRRIHHPCPDPGRLPLAALRDLAPPQGRQVAGCVGDGFPLAQRAGPGGGRFQDRPGYHGAEARRTGALGNQGTPGSGGFGRHRRHLGLGRAQ